MYAIVFKQVLSMFILAGIGFILIKSGKVSLEASRGIGNILIYLSLPCVIISGFLVDRTPEKTKGLLISAAAAFIVLVGSVIISRLFGRRNALSIFAGAFSNPGFFGAPIIIASMGSGAVFYVAFFIAFLNLFQWTIGVSLIKSADKNGIIRKKENTPLADRIKSGVISTLKSLRSAPFMYAIIIGLFMYFTKIRFPYVIGNCVTFLAGLNTPLAMFTIGIYFSQTDPKKFFVKPKLYIVSLIKLVVIPLCALLLLIVFPTDDVQLKMCVFIASACPVGSNIAVYAQLHDSDYGYAVETVIMSTLFSIVTLPLLVLLAEGIF